MKDGHPVGYLYREKPDAEADSGWRVLSGEETQEYADDPANFAMYNASTLVEVAPEVWELLGDDFPVEYERDSSGFFVKVAV